MKELIMNHFHLALKPSISKELILIYIHFGECISLQILQDFNATLHHAVIITVISQILDKNL